MQLISILLDSTFILPEDIETLENTTPYKGKLKPSVDVDTWVASRWRPLEETGTVSAPGRI
jgi:hypothetical protein